MKTKVDAVRIVKDCKLPDWAQSALRLPDGVYGALRSKGFMNFDTFAFRVLTYHGWKEGALGDWLVRDNANGIHTIVSDEEFNKKYVLSPTEPTIPKPKYAVYITEVVVADGIEDKQHGIRIKAIRYHGGQPGEITLASTCPTEPVVIRNQAQWSMLKLAIEKLEILE